MASATEVLLRPWLNHGPYACGCVSSERPDRVALCIVLLAEPQSKSPRGCQGSSNACQARLWVIRAVISFFLMYQDTMNNGYRLESRQPVCFRECSGPGACTLGQPRHVASS